jgi:uncharacterized protein (TIGR02284 family)
MERYEAINDLIEINNDRVEGYEKASRQADDEDLRTLFNNMALQSRRFVGELRERVNAEGGNPSEGTTAKGKVYRTWMDVKATFTGKDHNRKSVLSACEFGEDAAQRAYESVLKEDEIQGDLRLTVENQKKSLRESHDKIKDLRDSAQPV